ncbi:PDR/VanB family oxidoreductase [Massilia suwonensis]|uniref:PDR/VanB family oxidoreductase n=1 Tax=Massilia suwonensis TaxID=648895 RepID=A0ABW0MMP1_9BURK
MSTPLPLQVRVVAKTREAEGIASFELASLDGGPLPAFSAGAHVDVAIAPGLTRQYSLCNHPSERHRYLIAVLRDPASRGGSAAMHERVQAGDVLTISEPKNHFALEAAEDYLLLAGGIGITPILCMAERLAQAGARFRLHYCARSRERAAFAERLAGSPFADSVRFHFDADPDSKLDLEGLLRAAQPATHVYVCGPAGFIDAVTGLAAAQGWAGGRVHREYFGAPAQPAGGQGADSEFVVRIASSGRALTVPSGKTVLAVLQEHGIEIPVSCEQGICGTCVTRVLSGTPEHRDHYLLDEERAANDRFTPCCSRACSPELVLDL